MTDATDSNASNISLLNEQLMATAQVFATPTDPNGVPLAGHAITWRSSNPAVATVSSTGVVKALTA